MNMSFVSTNFGDGFYARKDVLDEARSLYSSPQE